MLIKSSSHPIIIHKVREPFGYLSNMSHHVIHHENKEYPTAESLFQALRFNSVKEYAIAEQIAQQSNPMRAKMLAKSHKQVLIDKQYDFYGAIDIMHMQICVARKAEQYPDLMQELLTTEDRPIIEDCSARASLSGLFWGMKLDESFGIWVGENMLGNIWQEQRNILRASSFNYCYFDI